MTDFLLSNKAVILSIILAIVVIVILCSAKTDLEEAEKDEC